MNKIICLFVFICISCAQKQNSKKENDVIVLESKIKNILLKVSSKDKSNLTYFNLTDYANFEGKKHAAEEKYIEKDTLFIRLKAVKTPQLMEIVFFGKYFHNTRIMLSPGDTVSIAFNQGKVTFSGKNEAHYNFYNKMNTSISLKYKNNAFWNDFKRYEKECKKIKDDQLLFLKQYIKIHSEVSEKFVILVKSEIEFEYLFNMMVPRKGEIKVNTSSKQVNNIYINKAFKKNQLINANSGEEKRYTLGFINSIPLHHFNRPELINNDYFKRSLKAYIINVSSRLDSSLNDNDSFLLKKKMINSQLKGIVQDLAIIYLLKEFNAIGFVNNAHNKEVFLTQIKNLKTKKLPLSYIDEIEDIASDININEHMIPESVLQEKLITITGREITFEELLMSYQNNNKIIHFWSYNDKITPSNIVNLHQFRKTLENDYKASYIYISLDDEQNKWSKFIHELEGDTNKTQHYRIRNRKKSDVINYYFKFIDFKKNWVQLPRWTLLDANNAVYLLNAPNPMDSIAFKDILNTKNNEKK